MRSPGASAGGGQWSGWEPPGWPVFAVLALSVLLLGAVLLAMTCQHAGAFE